MTLGLMQPYFLPYLGYFDLIRQTDLWIVFDTAQHIRRGWVHRNRIHKRPQGWSYIAVPVHHAPIETAIHRIRPDDSQAWRERILAQFDALSPQAPFHKPARALLATALTESRSSLADLNIRLLTDCCGYLGIPFRHRRLSEMNLDIGPVDEPGDWALRLCQALGADSYLNPPGGRALYNPERFAAAGVTLAIQEFTPFIYPTGQDFSAEENLSIIDVLAWNSPESIIRHLDSQPRYFARRP
jgi:hypothetical protein